MYSSNWILNTVFAKYCWTRYYFFKNTMTSLLVPPESVRGATRLDRTAFTTTVELPFLKFRDVTISEVIPVLKKYLVKVRNFKSIQNTANETIVYLNPKLIQNFENFSENDRQKLAEVYEQFGTAKVTVKYDNWDGNDILKAILPKGIDVPSSYSLVGHIVHLNLRDEHLPYKNVIGQVLLDTIPSARTVVNKVNTIDTTFRHFTMEILAGDKNTITVTKENGFTYELDFSQVYWNSRLCTEHLNLIKLMKPKDTLYDVFAGIGPFSIPAARAGVNVFANDLNPESYKWLQRNAVINKVTVNFKSFNLDGREFIKSIVKADILNRRANNGIGTEHIAMNLPSNAVDFLDVFHDCFNKDEIERICYQPPTIHLYCFVKANKGEDACRLGQLLVEEKLGCALNNSLINLHQVRKVSPFKEMIRVSFLLTRSVLKGEEPATKKLKVESNSNTYVSDNIAENNGKKQGTEKESEEQECIQSSNCS
ncbi:tRNA (guanine(37)-N1)-methyltransferase-like isoform X1 [Hylaeus anthracinus]|uniref:tRNA (guanine(37)-N1)-methyltransferase-like isoform X1 n=1 Tax=Hylaeus anthracinus TaxID=313031 RepID=UPI0023B9C3A9|nr:tRNA (guanine(37)-N1)-methyltransferase-like isoform X1 [Hylaeus anthracinus]